jgi:hypothetical protein
VAAQAVAHRGDLEDAGGRDGALLLAVDALGDGVAVGAAALDLGGRGGAAIEEEEQAA